MMARTSPINSPEGSLGIIDPARLEAHTLLGESHEELFRSLVELPSGANAWIRGRDHLLLVHEGKTGEKVASVQYNRVIKKAGETLIFYHRAVSLILDSEGILLGEGHQYVTATRRSRPNHVQRRELTDTVTPLSDDDIARFREFIETAREQLRNRPK